MITISPGSPVNTVISRTQRLRLSSHQTSFDPCLCQPILDSGGWHPIFALHSRPFPSSPGKFIDREGGR